METLRYTFLDLPNGESCNLNMNGYSGNDYQTIEKLKKGEINSITNVTNTTSYTWNELKNTIKTIFNTEKLLLILFILPM